MHGQVDLVTSGNWNTPANWSSSPALPAAPDDARIGGGLSAVVNSVIGAAPRDIQVGNTPAGSTLDITSGSLSNTREMGVSIGSNNVGVVNITGGTLNVGDGDPQDDLVLFPVQAAASATLNVSGGNLNVSDRLRLSARSGATADVNLTGGTVVANRLRVGANMATGGNPANAGNNNLNINGGSVTATTSTEIGINSNTGVVSLSGGTPPPSAALFKKFSALKYLRPTVYTNNCAFCKYTK